MKRILMQAIKGAKDDFKTTQMEGNIDNLDMELLEEHSFMYSVSFYGLSVFKLADNMLAYKDGSKEMPGRPTIKSYFLGSFLSTFDRSVLLSFKHLDFVMR